MPDLQFKATLEMLVPLVVKEIMKNQLFKKYDIIDYIVSCYGALHTMGGLAITEDIHSLIQGIKENEQNAKQ